MAYDQLAMLCGCAVEYASYRMFLRPDPNASPYRSRHAHTDAHCNAPTLAYSNAHCNAPTLTYSTPTAAPTLAYSNAHRNAPTLAYSNAHRNAPTLAYSNAHRNAPTLAYSNAHCNAPTLAYSNAHVHPIRDGTGQPGKRDSAGGRHRAARKRQTGVHGRRP